MYSLPVTITAVFKVLVVHGLTSYNIHDLCSPNPTPTSTPTIHLRSETTILTIPASLTLARQCDLNITWDDIKVEIELTSDPYNITGMSLPCNWISAEWATTYGPHRAYVCPTRADHILMWPSYSRTFFTIRVNATTGLEKRTQDLVLILTPQYKSCKGTEYDEDGHVIGVCCNHGVNETAEDFTECYMLGYAFTCIHKSMLCDGVKNCGVRNDEENCMTASGVVFGGGGVAWWVFGGFVVLVVWW